MGEKLRDTLASMLTSKYRFGAARRKKKLSQSEEVKWVLNNLKTKPEPNSGDSVDGATVDGTIVRAFGEIEFQGATRRARSKFIQISNESSPENVFKLMTEKWKVDKPQILISVTGGAKSCNLKPKLKDMFVNGLRKMSQTPGCWIITGGTNTGVMKHVGEALQGQSKTLIGIATWGIVSDKESLVQSKEIPLGGRFPYIVKSSLDQKGACLDHNHTHFLLIHDGSEGDFQSEIPFRSEFEKFIMENSSGGQEDCPNQTESDKKNVPSVMLVVEGGPGTVETVHGACQRSIPVVLIKDSGRAADALAYAYNNLSKDFIENSEIEDKELMSVIKKNFQDIPSKDARDKEEKFKDLYEKIRGCIKHKKYITVFQMSNDSDLDEAILSAVLTCQDTKPGLQLQLTLLWDRPDLASNFILWKFSDLEKEDLPNAVIMALALNRVEFLELLLHYCISLKSIIKKPVLEFLYGYASYKYQSPINKMIKDDDYFGYDDPDYSATVKTLCTYTSQQTNKCCISLSKIEEIIRRLCTRLITKGNEKIMENLDADLNNEFHYLYGVLFFWALLNNMHKMARFLWQMEEEGIAKVIIAAEINKQLALQVDQRAMAEELQKTFLNNSEDFKDLAIKILNECYSTNEKQTEFMITRELSQFPGHTCLSLANCSGQEEFIAHSSVQQLLNDVWTGVLKSRELSTFRLLLAIFCPPLIYRFKFQNKTELQHMIHVEDSFNDDEEEYSKIKKESHAEEVIETRQGSGSEINLISTEYEDYRSCQRQVQTEEIEGKKQEIEEEKQELNWFLKLIEFYFRTPAIKFVTSMISYFIFLGLFAYVAMLEKKESNPGVAEWILVVFVISFTFEEINQVCQSNAVGLDNKLRRYFFNIWNIMDVTAFSLFFVALGLRLNTSTIEYGHLFYGIDSWIWILRLLRVFYAHRKLGPYVVMIGKMFKDMMYFIIILVVFLVAYGVATNAILKPRKATWSMLSDIFWHSYFNIYGELFIDDPDKDTTSFGTPKINNYAEPVAWVFLALYLLVANVLLLNLLIAIFGNTFEEVQKKSDQVWKYERYDLVIEYYNRPGLVPPLMILEHVWSLVTYIYRKLSSEQTPQITNELQISLSKSEKVEIMEFEMDCIANMLRDKSPNCVNE